MRAVAKEAGVSAATVVLHFKSKVALLEASISEDIQLTLMEALETLPKGASLLKRLMHIPIAMFSLYDTDRPLYRAMVRSTVFEQEKDNPVITSQLNDYLLFLAQTIEEEKTSGVVRRDVDSTIAAFAIGSLYMGVLIRFFRTPDMTPKAAIDMLDALSQQYLSGILTKRK